jgi:hypothetical protein
MTIIGLIVAIVITGVVVWLTDQAARKRPPSTAYPVWVWVIYGVLIVLWLVALAYVFGLMGNLNVPIGAGVDTD